MDRVDPDRIRSNGRFVMSKLFVRTALVLGLALGLANLASAQQGRRPGGGFGGIGGLLANPDVAKELKLTEEQVTKVKEAGQQVREKFKDSFAKLKDASE